MAINLGGLNFDDMSGWDTGGNPINTFGNGTYYDNGSYNWDGSNPYGANPNDTMPLDENGNPILEDPGYGPGYGDNPQQDLGGGDPNDPSSWNKWIGTAGNVAGTLRGGGSNGGSSSTSGGSSNNTNLPKIPGIYLGGGGPDGGGPNGGGTIPSWAEQILQNTSGGTGSFLSNPFLPKILSMLGEAWGQDKKGDQYMQMAQDATDKFDPFGKWRPGYGETLNNLASDPSALKDAIKNDPAYIAERDLALDAADRGAAKDGLAFSGGHGDSSIKLADKIAGAHADKILQRYGDWAGSGIGPGTAGGIWAAGMQGSIAADQGRLAALTAALNSGLGSLGVNAPKGSTPQNTWGNMPNMPDFGFTPTDWYNPNTGTGTVDPNDMGGWMGQDNPFGGQGGQGEGGYSSGSVNWDGSTPDNGSQYGMNDRSNGTQNSPENDWYAQMRYGT